MDRAGHKLLEDLRHICSLRTERYWELLATAAGNTESMAKTICGLETQNLKIGAEISGPPVMAEERVLALSVSNPTKLHQLFSEWQSMHDQQQISRDDAWLIRAWGQAKRYFTVEQYDFQAPSWSWHEEFTPFSHNGRILSQRPLREKVLTAQDLCDAVENGAGVLRALRTQDVELDAQAFYYYSEQVGYLDSYHLALLIEISRRTNFNQDIWIKSFLSAIPTAAAPLDLTPAVYCLLNPSWCVP